MPNAKFTAYQVNFLAIYEAQMLQTLETDGLLGLSPMSYRKGNSGEEINLLVNELKVDKVIDKAMFAV